MVGEEPADEPRGLPADVGTWAPVELYRLRAQLVNELPLGPDLLDAVARVDLLLERHA